ncbi:MAG: hypothetical protein JWM39_86 [Parcubacteria group bacterium]|nr:hypothetical protein [Parcubacteria group bacterium]
MNTIASNPIQQLATLAGVSLPVMTGILAAVAIWTIIWKGLGMWRAARNHQMVWFLVFLIVNDIGILEIIYLLWFRSDKDAMVTRVATGSAVVPEAQ